LKCENMNIHLKILAVIYLFLGYGLLLMFIFGHIAFFQYWQDYKSSVMSDADSFYRNYTEFFASYGVSPLKNLVVIFPHLAFGHGILRRKRWAAHLGFLLALTNLLFYVWDIFYGFVEITYVVGIALYVYTLWVLFSNKETFLKAEDRNLGEKS